MPSSQAGKASASGALPPPEKVFADADVLLGAVVASHEQHDEATALMQRLVEQRDRIDLHLCSLAWIEFAQCFLDQEFRRDLAREVSGLGALDVSGGWADPATRKEYVWFVRQKFEGILAPFEWREIFLNEITELEAIDFIIQHDLDPATATHLACARAAEIAQLVTLNRSLGSIEGFQLWSSRVEA